MGLKCSKIGGFYSEIILLVNSVVWCGVTVAERVIISSNFGKKENIIEHENDNLTKWHGKDVWRTLQTWTYSVPLRFWQSSHSLTDCEYNFYTVLSLNRSRCAIFENNIRSLNSKVQYSLQDCM